MGVWEDGCGDKDSLIEDEEVTRWRKWEDERLKKGDPLQILQRMMTKKREGRPY